MGVSKGILMLPKVKQLRSFALKPAMVLQLFALAAPLAVLIAHVWGVRFTTADDGHFAQLMRSEQFAQSQSMATSSGRVMFLYYMPFLYFAISFWQSAIYDIIQYGTFALTLVMMAWVLTLYISWRFAFVAALFYISTVALKWDHTLITSNPLFLHFHIVLLCLSLVSLHRFKKTGGAGWNYASLVLLGFSMIGLEFQAVIAPCVYVAAAGMRADDEARVGPRSQRLQRARYTVPVALMFAAYLSVVVGWRLYNGSAYGGVTPNVAAFDYSAAWGIVSTWTVSGNILFHWFQASTVPFLSSDILANQDRHLDIPIALDWSAAGPVALVVAGAVAAGTVATFGSPQNARNELRPGSRSWAQLPLVFLVIALTPTVLLSLTTKYQDWYSNHGVKAYAYTSISGYGVAMLASWGFLTLVAAARSRVWRIAVIAVFTAMLGAAAFTNVNHTANISRTMQDSTARWRAVDLLMRSSLRRQVEGAIVVAPRLGNQYWSTPTDEAYWDRFVRAAYGGNVTFRFDIRGADVVDRRPIVAVDFFRTEDENEIVVVLSPLIKDAATSGVHAVEVYVVSRNPVTALLVGQGRMGERFASFLPDARLPATDRLANYYIRLPSSDVFQLALEDRPFWAPVRYPRERQLVRFGVPIDFSRGGNSTSFKKGGWSGPEAMHTWTEGRESTLTLLTAEPAKCDLRARMDLAGFVPPGHADQVLEILVNRQSVWAGSIGERRTVAFTVPKALWNSEVPAQMVLRHPDAVSPASAGVSQDGRELGIALFGLLVSDCGAPPSP